MKSSGLRVRGPFSEELGRLVGARDAEAALRSLIAKLLPTPYSKLSREQFDQVLTTARIAPPGIALRVLEELASEGGARFQDVRQYRKLLRLVGLPDDLSHFNAQSPQQKAKAVFPSLNDHTNMLKVGLERNGKKDFVVRGAIYPIFYSDSTNKRYENAYKAMQEDMRTRHPEGLRTTDAAKLYVVQRNGANYGYLFSWGYKDESVQRLLDNYFRPICETHPPA